MIAIKLIKKGIRRPFQFQFLYPFELSQWQIGDMLLSKLMIAIEANFFEIPEPLKYLSYYILLGKLGTKYMQALNILICPRKILEGKLCVIAAVNMYPQRSYLLYHMILKRNGLNISS